MQSELYLIEGQIKTRLSKREAIPNKLSSRRQELIAAARGVNAKLKELLRPIKDRKAVLAAVEE